MSSNTFRVVRRYPGSNKPPKVMATGQSEHTAQMMCSNPVPENPPSSMAIPGQPYANGTSMGPTDVYVDSYETEG